MTKKTDWEKEWYVFVAEVFGRHPTLWNYSKKETIEKTKKLLSQLLKRERGKARKGYVKIVKVLEAPKVDDDDVEMEA